MRTFISLDSGKELTFSSILYDFCGWNYYVIGIDYFMIVYLIVYLDIELIVGITIQLILP